jgi:pimeloyl-ACP methyl ester carboxylesterase
MGVEDLLQSGIAAAKAGNLDQASALLSQVVQADPASELGWLWLGICRSVPAQREFCFRKVLSIHPGNAEAQRLLESLRLPSVVPPMPSSTIPSTDPPASFPPPVSEPVKPDGRQPIPAAAAADRGSTALESKKPEITDSPPKKKTRKTIVWGVLFLALGIGLVLEAYWFLSSRIIPQDTPIATMTWTTDAQALILPSTLESSTVTASPSATTSPTPSPTPVSGSPTSSPTHVSGTAFSTLPCDFEIPAGAYVECGYVTVPEDRSDDLSRTIRLAVAVYHSSSRMDAPDAVIFLAGGPGEGAIEWAASAYSSVILPILQERDFIVFDQRGTGLSEPALDCDEIKDVYVEELIHPASEEGRVQLYTDALTACRDRLEKEGVDLAAYTTGENAADVVNILAALEYSQADLYGVSYGTRLAQFVMRDYPDKVRSVVLDSVVPLEVNMINDGSAASNNALQALFDGCAADSDCEKAYPRLKATFSNLMQQLKAKPLTVDVSLPGAGLTYQAVVDGNTFASVVLWTMRYSGFVPMIPQAITRAKAGDTAALSYALELPAYSFSDIALGDYISINCHDQIYATTPEEMGKAMARYAFPQALGFTWISDNPQILFNVCKLWGARKPGSGENDPVVSDIPALILAGKYDPITPPAFAQQLSNHLSHSYVLVFPDQSHCPTVGEEQCPMAVVVEFLHNPEVKPKASCLEEMTPLRFVVPYTGKPAIKFATATNTKMGVAGSVPSDWDSLGLGFYSRGNTILDVTQIGVQGDKAGAREWIVWLMKEFNGRAGFDREPVKAGERKANKMVWTLYKTTSQGRPVDLAFSEQGTWTLMVIMLSFSDERDALFQAVFLPVVDSTALIK